MKKIIILITFILFIHMPVYSTDTEIIESQKSALNIQGFISESQKYTKEMFPDLDTNLFLESAIKGNIDNSKLVNTIFSILGKEVKNSARLMAGILVIIIIHSILKSITDGLENKSISEVIYYAQYILIVTLIISNFSEIISLAKDSIGSLVGFMYSLVPLLITLMISTGSIISGGLVQPILLFFIGFIGNLISTILLPILLISTAIIIVSNVSDKVQLDRLAKFFKSSIVWVLGIVLTIFVGVLSIEGTLSSSVDGLTAKTAKAAVSTFIPVVGKILGDTVDTVMGCTAILKNAVGLVGIVVILGICIAPILKIAILSAIYSLTAAICEPIADAKIIKLLANIGDTFKILLGMLITVSVMLIIGITLVVKISNVGLMYR